MVSLPFSTRMIVRAERYGRFAIEGRFALETDKVRARRPFAFPSKQGRRASYSLTWNRWIARVPWSSTIGSLKGGRNARLRGEHGAMGIGCVKRAWDSGQLRENTLAEGWSLLD